MKRIAALTIGFVMGLAAVLSAEAADAQPLSKPNMCPICRQANNQQAAYAKKAGSTLVRGAINTAFGWTELLVQPTEEVNHGGNLATGIGKGLGLAIKRTALGFGELLTFWTPKGKEGHVILARDCPICFSTPVTTQANPAASPPSPSIPSR